MTILREAISTDDYDVAVELFQEYKSYIGLDLSFQDFNNELREIESQYSRPNGKLIIAYDNYDNPVGCVGIRRLTGSICELKRMYTKSSERGKGIGKLLLERAISSGKELKFKKMRLDTLPTMKAAIRLYEKVGFYEIDSYRFNPFEEAIFFEINLEE